ncbi:MAG TPA: hypothetical protein VFH70_03485 [Acidimicrobiales bacterium]|nr:hypothetical protein [Acidimicrobiales bacterium]
MPVARVVAEVLVWAAVTFSVWMISLSAAPLQEYLLAAGCSVLAAITACWARRALDVSWTLTPGWLAPLWKVPLVAVTDLAQVVVAALRPGQAGGRFETVHTTATGDAPASRSRRALAAWFMSVSPGSYLLDANPGDGELIVHRLTGGPGMEKQLERW